MSTEKDTEKKKERARKFGAFLKKLRDKNGWSLRQVEEKTGKEISHPYLSQLERGERSVPNLELIRKLAKAFGEPIENFLREAGYVTEDTATTAEAKFFFRGYEKLSSKNRAVLKGVLEQMMKSEES